MKICSKCKKEKPLSDFSKHKNCKGGILSYCKKCDQKRHIEYRKTNGEKISKHKRIYNLKKRYGIDIEFYEYLLKKQNNKCAICDNTLGTNDGHRLAVDHNHKTGTVRGLLCKVCNNAIGLFRENEKYFLKAIRYLKEA